MKKLLYDSGCLLCRILMIITSRLDRKRSVEFIPFPRDVNPHSLIFVDGAEVKMGGEAALRLLDTIVNHRVFSMLLRGRLVGRFIVVGYDSLARLKNRLCIGLSSGCDAPRIHSFRRIRSPR